MLARIWCSALNRVVRSSTRHFRAVASREALDPNCPLMNVDSHYVVKTGADTRMPQVVKVDYIDSGIVWRNFHSDQVQVCYKSDYEHCQVTNQSPNSKSIAFWMPEKIINSCMCDDGATTECQNWLSKEWPMFAQAEDLYSRPRLQFALGVARLCSGLNADRSPLVRHLTLLITIHAFWIDDLNERLNQLDDGALFKSWRQNLDRIVENKEDLVPQIELSSVSNFPKEDLAKADFVLSVMRDVMERLHRDTSASVVSLYKQSYHYAMDHVEIEREMRHPPAQNGPETVEEAAAFLEWKSGISAVTFTTTPLYSSYDASFLTVQDPFLTLAEIAVTCEGDSMSFFKENMNGQQIGNVHANANLIDRLLRNPAVSLRQAFANNAVMRNECLKAMITMYEHLNPRDRPRALTAMRNVCNLGDYQIRLGVDQLNPRYGWYPHDSEL